MIIAWVLHFVYVPTCTRRMAILSAIGLEEIEKRTARTRSEVMYYGQHLKYQDNVEKTRELFPLKRPIHPAEYHEFEENNVDQQSILKGTHNTEMYLDAKKRYDTLIDLEYSLNECTGTS